MTCCIRCQFLCLTSYMLGHHFCRPKGWWARYARRRARGAQRGR